MRTKILFVIAVLSLCFIHTDHLDAQTHADATSQKWKGIDVETDVLSNSSYPDNNTIASGYPFILYNVGTGRFVVQGGDWAMEGRLFYSDFGRTMYMYSNGRINSGLTESGIAATKNCFCVRPPEPFGKDWKDATYSSINLTTLMDGAVQTNKYDQLWHFERVEDPSNTATYTYYMYQHAAGTINKDYYLGAAWGECHNTSVGKGDGQFVFMDDDRCCWTTGTVKGNTQTMPLENGDKVEIQKLYQWRLISVSEFIDVLNGEAAGLNPSISALIPDRDFTRNSDDFYYDSTKATAAQNAGTTYSDYWKSARLSNPISPYGSSGNDNKRHLYTWGNWKKQTNQKKRASSLVVNESWNAPVLLKVVFDKVTSESTDDQPAGKKNAKFGFMSFEGVGSAYTHFQVPKAGWYQIQCVGFSMSASDNDAYLFAQVINDDAITTEQNSFPSTDDNHYGHVVIEKLPFGTFSKNNYENCRDTGRELLYNANSHKQNVWVQVTQADYDANKKTIRLGVRKDLATKSDLVKYTYIDSNTEKTSEGYYDTDWVCIDDIRATYMGLSPVFFYEDMEDLSYLDYTNYVSNTTNVFSENEYIPTTLDGRYGGAANLQRKFTTGEWNTFSFLLPMTGEQVRSAFGDESALLKLNSIGGLSDNDCIIDFETVNLITLDPVVTAGNLYLLKPSKDPSYGETPRNEMADFYDLGKMFFSTKASDATNPDYNHPVIDLSTIRGSQAVTSFENKNNGTAYITYTQTPGYSSFAVTNGIYNGSTAPAGSYAPKGSYVMSGGKMYELARDTRIKGFRGWITLEHSIFDEQNGGTSAHISIDGVVDGDLDVTSIDSQNIKPVSIPDHAPVYDLSGRKVGTFGDTLPRGLYIINGKKLLIK